MEGFLEISVFFGVAISLAAYGSAAGCIKNSGWRFLIRCWFL